MKAPKKELLKFCQPDLYAISNFESRKLLCQHCSNYKGTLGSWLKILEGIPDTKKEPERFAAALNAWGLTEAPNMEELHEYFSECVDYQPSFELLKNSVRISSFSTQRFNPLIWSNYADGLHGFCIVFDEKVLMDKEHGGELRDVEYSCSAPTIDTFEYAIAHDQYIFHQLALEEEITFLSQQEQDYTTKVIEAYKTAADKAFTKKREFWHKIFAVKPSELEYECERRLIVPVDLKDNSPSFFTYSSDAVIEVILGEDMNKSYRKKLYALIKERYPEVTISTAQRAKNGTGIEVSP